MFFLCHTLTHQICHTLTFSGLFFTRVLADLLDGDVSDWSDDDTDDDTDNQNKVVVKM